MADTADKKYLLLNWVLLISYGCIILFAVYSSIYCWPTKGSVIWFLVIIFCPPFLYHLVFIGYALIFNQLLHWKKSYRLITLVTGILLAGGLLQLTQTLSLARFKTAYSPLVKQIQAKMPTPCAADYFEIPQVHAYNLSVTQKILQQKKPLGALYYNPQRFVLCFRAGSVDVAGSSLVYDSRTKQWDFFHQSEIQAIDKFNVQINKLIKCRNF